MNRLPSRPPKTPRITAPGTSSSEAESPGSSQLNLMEPESDNSRRSPDFSASKTVSMKVLIEEQTKLRQSRENVQKVLGEDTS